MVYSILTRSLEYSKAIHCTPFWSCRTTRGVVAGIGPGAALGLTLAPDWGPWCTLDALPGGPVGVAETGLIPVPCRCSWGPGSFEPGLPVNAGVTEPCDRPEVVLEAET